MRGNQALLADQAKHCSGRNASQREPQRQINGRNFAKARGVCKSNNGKVLNLTYKVLELGQRMVMIVMEIGSAGGAKSVQSIPNKAAPNAGTGNTIRVPGPNQL